MPELTVVAPPGSHFTSESVKTDKGTKNLGEVPLLVWDELDQMKMFYGDEGVLAIADGTSLRVSFQNIARRFKAANKTDDEIAKAQIDFRPGKRSVGATTPASRVARAAKTVVEKGANADDIEKLLDAIAAGKLSGADLSALVN